MAAANNAEWCEVVCRSHRGETRFDDDAWTSRTRTPPYFPDAVTLVPNPSVPDLLGRIDASAGCSIKDSFASLDLAAFGFRVLFDAEWIVRTSTTLPRTALDPRWEVVHERTTFALWETAWRGDDGPSGVLLGDLLDYDSVAVLAGRSGDRVVAGAVLNRSAAVVGISNFFTSADAGSVSWASCLALAGRLFPGSIFVGYESGDALDAARTQGFESASPLRVWIQ
jgi:hypothetical protein